MTESIETYLDVATQPAKDFRPLTQAERTALYVNSLTSPWSYVRGVLSSGIEQLRDKPHEWGADTDAFAQRYANIEGQYSIRKTVTFLSSSALHEDNRYFRSGKHGFWPRAGYALESSFLARRDDGSRTFSISQVGGVAAGAFAARLWLPPSENHAGDGAISFGITMGSNAVLSVVKEFLPDLTRAAGRKMHYTSADRH